MDRQTRCLQCVFEHVVQFTECSLVAAAVAVVGRAEHRHDALVMTPVETLQKQQQQLGCGPMPNVMAALPNTGGTLCSMPQSLADAHYLTAMQ